MVNARRYWLDTMLNIADPVLRNLSRGTLRLSLPDVPPERELYAPLEAFGRTMTGIAPWLESDDVPECEKNRQEQYRALCRKCLDAATDPNSPDCMNFTEGYGQSLVDAAFLAHAILRAPRELWHKLEPRVKRNLADALISTRKLQPYQSNWLFFSAMIETALCVSGESYDREPILRATECFEKWYAGDGAYGDGEMFRFDYYNSYVIHPMYVDIVRTMSPRIVECADVLPSVMRRATRYAEVLERMIAPDGTYPVTGRSVCYRFGAFHALAQAAYEGYLPRTLSPAAVRCALTAVMERTARGGMTDKKGFLRVGVYGSQPSLAEHYISVGSLYLCETVFLPLGLPPSHPFWSNVDEDWTNKKIWSGADMPCDCAQD